MIEATYFMVVRKKKHEKKCALAEEAATSGVWD